MSLKSIIGRFAIGLAALIMAGCAAPPVATPPAGAPQQTPAPLDDARNFDAAELLARTNPSKALEAYQGFVVRFPDSRLAPEALMRIGAIASERGNLQAARAAFEQVTARYGDTDYGAKAALELLRLDYAEGQFQSMVDRAAQLPLESFEPSTRALVLEMLADGFLALDQPVEAAYAAARAWVLAADERRSGLIQKAQLALSRLKPEAMAELLSRPMGEEARRLLQSLGRETIYDHHLIGVLLPLTGSHAFYGQRALRGVELALARFAATHEGETIRMLIEDTGSDDGQTVQAVAKLDANGVAAIIGPMATVAAAAPAAQERRIPMIVFTQREFIASFGDYIFRHFITPRMQAEALVRWAVEHEAMSRFAVLYPQDRYGQTFLADFEEYVEAAGAKIVRSLSYDPAQTDFADQIRQLIVGYAPIPGAEPIESSGRSDLKPPTVMPIVDCDALFIPEAPSKTGLILPQLAYHDVTQSVLMGTNLWQSKTLLDMAGRYAEGAVFTSAFFEKDETPAVVDFSETFASVYGESPGFIEAVAFDTGMMLCDTISRPQVRSRAQIRDTLHQSSFPGAVSGETWFDQNGESHKALRLMEIQNGGFVVREILPAPPITLEGR